MRNSKKAVEQEDTSPFIKGGQWNDVVWRFPVTTAGAHQSVFSINWAIPLGNDLFLTDVAHAVVLESWRRVLWTMLVTPPDGHPRKGSFCGRFSTGLRLLAPWMVETSRRDLGDLDQAALCEFLEVLIEKFNQGTDDEVQDVLDDSGITMEAMATYITIFSYAYEVRHHLREAGLPTPAEDPLAGRSALVIAGEICTKFNRQTPEMSDETFIKTVNTAMSTCEASWLEPLIALCGSLSSETSVEKKAHLCMAFGGNHPEIAALHADASMAVRYAINRVRAACEVLLQSTAGLRVSELCGIPGKGLSQATGLPSSITTERTFDDEYEVFTLNASIFKHTTTSEPASWVLGMRPTGSRYMPPPVRAITIMQCLDDGWRRKASIDTLLLMFSNNFGVPHDVAYVNPVNANKLRERQRRWMADTGCITTGQRVTTHMWRKTFARYLIRVSADFLPAISHHLKHLSIAMTENSYCRPNPAMQQMIVDARVEEAGALILGTIMGSKRLEGPIAAEIKALGSELGPRLGNRPKEDIPRDVSEEVRERRLELYGNEVGFCVFRSDSARCHILSAEPIAPFLRLAPAFAERRADTCHRCLNFGIGEEHLPFWEAKRSDLSARLMACETSSSPAVMACLKRALDRCDTVIGWMKQPGGTRA